MANGFTKYDDIINAASTTGTMQRVNVYKTMTAPATDGAGVAKSSFASSGNPGTGTDGTVGVANGRVLTKSSAGAIQYNNAASGNNYLTSVSVTSLINLNNATDAPRGVLLLVDRIADCRLAYNQATASITGLTAISRLNSAGSAYAAGCQIFLEAINAPTVSNTSAVNYTYTNSEGTGSQVSQNTGTTTTTAVQGGARCPPYANDNSQGTRSYPFVGLSGTDRGVRSIESVTKVGNTDAGNYNLCLMRIIAVIPIFYPAVVTNKDFVVEVPCLERIWDNSYLQFIFMDSSRVTNLGFDFIAQLRMVSL